MKRAISFLSLVAFGSLAGLAAAEVGLRLFPELMPLALRPELRVDDAAIQAAHRERATLLMEDAYLGRVLQPNAHLHVQGHPDYTYDITTISPGFGNAGFRDDRLEMPVYAVAVGDSFTFGDGVSLEDTWVERLEAGLGLDVVNEGVPGYSAIEEVRDEALYALPLNPEVVIWAYFNNDPKGDWEIDQWLDSGESSLGGWQVAQQISSSARGRPNGGQPGVIPTFLTRHSHVFAVIDLAVQAANYPYQPYVDDSLDFRFKFRDNWERFLDPEDEQIQAGLHLAQASILEGKSLADEQGTAFVLVLIPFKEQVYWEIVSQYVENPQAYDVDWMTNAMLDFCAANDLTCIDLLPGLRAHAAQGEQLYFRTDGHWNEAGHALAAELIKAGLAEHGLLPDP